MKLALNGKNLNLYLDSHFRNTLNNLILNDYLLYLYWPECIFVFVFLGPVSMKLQTSGKITAHSVLLLKVFISFPIISKLFSH